MEKYSFLQGQYRMLQWFKRLPQEIEMSRESKVQAIKEKDNGS